MKQYPLVGSDFDDFDEGNGDVDEMCVAGGLPEPSMYEDDEHGDDDTFKEEISPNEACYVEVEPIESNALIPLNDSVARSKAQ